MTTKHTTTTTTTTERSPRTGLRRLLGIFAAATALTAGACADLDDPAWAESRGETANDSFDDEDYPIGRSHGLDEDDTVAWGDGAYDLDERTDDALEHDDESQENEGEEEDDCDDENDENDEDDYREAAI